MPNPDRATAGLYTDLVTQVTERGVSHLRITVETLPHVSAFVLRDLQASDPEAMRERLALRAGVTELPAPSEARGHFASS